MKTVVITGSTRGIGFGMAEAFLERNHNIVVSGRGQAAVGKAVQALNARFPAERILGQPCDVSDADQVQALWDAAAARFGRVDIWINNAGIGTPVDVFWKQTPKTLNAVVSTNLTGMMYCCAAAIRGMIAQGGGHIYNMEGLGSGGEYQPGNTTYGSTKSAVRYLTKALIQETKGTPVKVSYLSPGIVATDLLMESIDPKRETELRRVLNILGDRIETVSPWLVERILANDRAGARIAWLTAPKVLLRFMLSPFNKGREVLPAQG
jgi:NAD(P)-dependent dehydrogenase (short-subunit alcohol dehydrogenase family)